MAVLFVTILALCVVTTFSEPTCSKDKYLNECGPSNISQQACEQKGCCYDTTVPEGKPVCFYKNDGYKYFNDAVDRISCGGRGTQKQECESNGCRYDPEFEKPWCYYPNTNIDPAFCQIDRADCGHPGIVQEDCEAKGCCWVPYYGFFAGNPWCFYASAVSEPVEEKWPSTGTLVTYESGTKTTTYAPEAIGVHTVHGEEAVGVISKPPEESPEVPFVQAPAPASEEEEEFVFWIEEGFGIIIEPPYFFAPAPVASQKNPTTNGNSEYPDETKQALEFVYDMDTNNGAIQDPKLKHNDRDMECDLHPYTPYNCESSPGCTWIGDTSDGICLYMPSMREDSMGKFKRAKYIY